MRQHRDLCRVCMISSNERGIGVERELTDNLVRQTTMGVGRLHL